LETIASGSAPSCIKTDQREFKVTEKLERAQYIAVLLFLLVFPPSAIWYTCRAVVGWRTMAGLCAAIAVTVPLMHWFDFIVAPLGFSRGNRLQRRDANP
jgi:hypothetical protein